MNDTDNMQQKLNLIFLTMVKVDHLRVHGIYQDLIRKFAEKGHKVFVVYPLERREGKNTEIKEEDGVCFLGVKTLNLQKTSVIEKGIGQILVERQYKYAVKKYFSNMVFDLILYSTPPITFSSVVSYLKHKNSKAIAYLLLKDILPQNAVDLGMMRKNGIKGLLYLYFRGKEKRLYALSDVIGCMSPANVKYVLTHNPEINPPKVEVAPNSIDLYSDELETEDRTAIRKKYLLPQDVPIFIYGGNLGRPQGIPFIIDCLEANSNRSDCHILIIGTGTELPKLKQWKKTNNSTSVTIMDGLPKEEYDKLVRACDVGLIFLDHRFTIPNYPSRLLSYLENKMPVLCATDPNTDIGQIASDNEYGLWCESNDVSAFTQLLNEMISNQGLIKCMGENGYKFLKNNYLTDNTYNAILKHLK